ncbi:MAG: branched-chain amino acid transaminase [Myxococcales bacterium]|nr:branched-chain amino acid transaminase [Myxococcales bacterium]
MAHIRPEKYIWLDGKLTPWDESHVHFLTHSLHYGLAAFEGIRAYAQQAPAGTGAIFRLQEHTDRLFDSCKLCLIDVPYSRDEINAACIETMRANGLAAAYLRPLVFLGDGSMGLGAMDPPVRVGIAAYVWGRYLGDDGIAKGIRAKISSFGRNNMQVGLPKGKICGQYVNSVLAKREVIKAGYDEAIMLDGSGQVAEATGENIFAVVRGRLVTPPLSAAILAGITRDSVLTLARDLGIPTVEEPIARDQLLLADEVFLTGTAAEVTPVREIDDRAVGTGQPGPITTRIQQTFFAATSGQLHPYSRWLTPIPPG